MLGGIYCGRCGQGLETTDRKGSFCQDHPNSFRVKFQVKEHIIQRRFSNYAAAEQCLLHLRYQYRDGTLDVRDWLTEYPSGFKSLSEQWLNEQKIRVEKGELKPKTFSIYRDYINRAQTAWDKTNIKRIGYAEIHTFLLSQPGSSKTRANIKACLHVFWKWLYDCGILDLHQMPRWPKVSYELGLRQIVDKDTQQQIIDEVFNLSFSINPKIWLGIKWLSTYISIRPGDLLRLREKDINVKAGMLKIIHPKDKNPRLIPLLEEDITYLKEIPRGLPDLKFFRHNPSYSSREGRPFGEKYFYKWWKRACANLGIEDVDLYGGTRHSSTTALREHYSFEEVKEATVHATNKAFERYYQMDFRKLRDVYERTQKQGGTVRKRSSSKRNASGTVNQAPQKANLLNFKK